MKTPGGLLACCGRSGAALAVLLCTSALDGAGDVPLGHARFHPGDTRPVGYRGDGTGRFAGATPVTHWDLGTGRNIRWRTRLPGGGHSTPIVVGDRVFVMADPGILLCVDRRNGEILWQDFPLELMYPEQLKGKGADELAKIKQAVIKANNDAHRWGMQHQFPTLLADAAAAMPDDPVLKQFIETPGVQVADSGTGIPNPMAVANLRSGRGGEFYWISYTFAPPVSDGRFVYVRYSVNMQLVCYDLDGRRQWASRLSNNAQRLRDSRTRAPRDSRYVRLYGNWLYTPGHEEYYIVDKRDGEVHRHELKQRTNSVGQAAAMVTVDERPYVMLGGEFDGNVNEFFDAATGKLAGTGAVVSVKDPRGKLARTLDVPTSGALTVGDTSYCALGSYAYRDNAGACAIRYRRAGEGFAGKMLWHTKLPAVTWRSGALAGGRLFLAGEGLTHAVLDAQTGAVVFEQKQKQVSGEDGAETAGAIITNNPASSRTHFFQPSWGGKTAVVDAATGKAIGYSQCEPMMGNGLFLHGDAIYTRGMFHLYCIGGPVDR